MNKTELEIYKFKLKKMNELVKSVVLQLNYEMGERFKSIGVENNPFVLVYDDIRKVPYKKKDAEPEYEVKLSDIGKGDNSVQNIMDMITKKKKKKQKLPLRVINDVYLVLDHDFIDDYNNRKINFYIWFNEKYPEEANKYYKKIVLGRESESKYELLRYKEEFFKDEPIPVWNFKKTKFPHLSGGDILLGGFTTKGDGTGKRHIKSFTSKDVDNFVKGENDLFNNSHNANRNVTKLLKFLPSEKADDIINKVLKLTLDDFRKVFINTNWEKLLKPSLGKKIDMYGNVSYSKYQKQLDMKKLNSGDDTLYLMSEKYQKQIYKNNTLHLKKYNKQPTVKREIKFPNIDNIRRWFISSGIYKSNFMQDLKYKEFNNKTMKGKISAINSAVFLIANGIYTRKTGEKTHFKQHGVLPPVALKTAGLKVSLKTALHLSRRNKYMTDRRKRNTYIDAAIRRDIMALRRAREYNTKNRY